MNGISHTKQNPQIVPKITIFPVFMNKTQISLFALTKDPPPPPFISRFFLFPFPLLGTGRLDLCFRVRSSFALTARYSHGGALLQRIARSLGALLAVGDW